MVRWTGPVYDLGTAFGQVIEPFCMPASRASPVAVIARPLGLGSGGPVRSDLGGLR